MNDKQSTYDSMMQRVAEYDDEDAFKYIFDDLYAPLCLYARRMVPPGAAEDIAQEVFVALWENRNDIIIETSLKGWLLYLGKVLFPSEPCCLSLLVVLAMSLKKIVCHVV